MDAHQQLAYESEIAYAVLGRSGSFTLVKLSGEIEPDVSAEALTKGYAYCGMVGVRNGQAIAQCESDADSLLTMVHAGVAATQLLAEHLIRPKEADAVGWLESLYCLADTREVAQ